MQDAHNGPATAMMPYTLPAHLYRLSRVHLTSSEMESNGMWPGARQGAATQKLLLLQAASHGERSCTPCPQLELELTVSLWAEQQVPRPFDGSAFELHNLRVLHLEGIEPLSSFPSLKVTIPSHIRHAMLSWLAPQSPVRLSRECAKCC